MGDTNGGQGRTRLEVAAPDCVAENFGGEIVALHITSGYYFSLRGLTGAIWRDLAAGHAVEDIVGGLRAVDGALAAKADELIAEITAKGLMRPAPEATPATAALESRSMAAAGVTGIALEAYDDLADLVMNDPIHDVDEEIGWPTLPNA